MSQIEIIFLLDVVRQSDALFDVAYWTGQARQGSQIAFENLYQRYLPLVHGILLGRFRPAIADELTQECFATAFSRLEQLREDEKFGAWLAAIARRVQPSEPTRESHDDGLADALSPDTTPEDRAEARHVLRTVSNLPEAYRETLMLRLVEGLSGAEIAALTGLTPESVRVNLHRGMERLRRVLKLRPTASVLAETRND